MTEQHVNPAEAVRMHRDLRAKQSIGMHWGTFELTDEALDEPPRALAEARREAKLPDDEFALLAVGQTRWLQPRQQAAACVTSTSN
jgi:N-acyl-phosphatidylethanolamine-hydrolysing phospholipase D